MLRLFLVLDIGDFCTCCSFQRCFWLSSAFAVFTLENKQELSIPLTIHPEHPVSPFAASYSLIPSFKKAFKRLQPNSEKAPQKKRSPAALTNSRRIRPGIWTNPLQVRLRRRPPSAARRPAPRRVPLQQTHTVSRMMTKMLLRRHQRASRLQSTRPKGDVSRRSSMFLVPELHLLPR